MAKANDCSRHSDRNSSRFMLSWSRGISGPTALLVHRGCRIDGRQVDPTDCSRRRIDRRPSCRHPPTNPHAVRLAQGTCDVRPFVGSLVDFEALNRHFAGVCLAVDSFHTANLRHHRFAWTYHLAK
jgi:hypothetical protein